MPKTTLIQKDPKKESIPMTDNISTHDMEIINLQIDEGFYYSLLCCGLFAEEQKLCYKETKPTYILVLIDQHVISETKTKQTDVVMVCINNKETYGIILQTWIADYL